MREVVDARFGQGRVYLSRTVGRGREWSSYEERTVDASVPGADEGRGKLRKASGSRKQALIRGCPNGETRRGQTPVTPG